MKKNGSVVGWVLEADRTKVLVREASGRVSAQKSSSDDELGPRAIQTGAFLRGKQILDPVTKELIRYEFEQITSAAIVRSLKAGRARPGQAQIGQCELLR